MHVCMVVVKENTGLCRQSAASGGLMLFSFFLLEKDIKNLKL